MPDTVDRLVLYHQYIDFDYLQYFLPLRFLQRDEVVPAGKAVSHESPIQAEHEVEEKHEVKEAEAKELPVQEDDLSEDMGALFKNAIENSESEEQ